MHVDTRTPGTSPDEKRVAISAFAGAPAIVIRPASAGESIPPATVELDVGCKVDEHAARCQALGMRVSPPTNVHWYRCYEVDIGDGHRIRLRGPKHPGLQIN